MLELKTPEQKKQILKEKIWIELEIYIFLSWICSVGLLVSIEVRLFSRAPTD